VKRSAFAARPIEVRPNPVYLPKTFVNDLGEVEHAQAAQRTTAVVIHEILRRHRMDPRLSPVDRWMRRWAASQGSGLPCEVSEEIRRSRLPPLNDDVAIETDKIVHALPFFWPRFVNWWYRSEKPPEVIGASFGLKRTAVYQEHRVVLGYLLGQFHAHELPIPIFPGIDDAIA
jgi:hypothetical protein